MSSPIIFGPSGAKFIGSPQGASGAIFVNDGSGNLSWTVPASTGALPKNHKINGLFDVWQRYSGNLFLSPGSSAFLADRAKTINNVDLALGTLVFVADQSTTIPTATQLGALASYALSIKANTGQSSFISTDYAIAYRYTMEGYDYNELRGRGFVYSAWIYATATGTYSISFNEASGTSSYVTTFNITASNTYQYIQFVVPADTIGTYNTSNGAALQINVASVGGSNFTTSTLNAWQAGQYFVANTAGVWTNTNANTVIITGDSIVVGSVGFASGSYERAGATIEEELSMCRRYCFVYGYADSNSAMPFATGMLYSTNQALVIVNFPTTMRAEPTLTYSNLTDFALLNNTAGPVALTSGALSINQAGNQSVTLYAAAASTIGAAGNATILSRATTNGNLIFDAEV